MKKPLFFTISIVALAAGIVLSILAYTYMIGGVDGLSAFLQNPIPNPGKVCLDYHRPTLNDPKSAYVVDYKQRLSQVTVNARGKNVFGAYIPLSVSCLMKNERQVDEARMLDLEFKLLTGQD